MHEKRPRQYATEIIELGGREARRAALDRVPEKYREWVAGYVRDHFALQRFLKTRACRVK